MEVPGFTTLTLRVCNASPERAAPMGGIKHKHRLPGYGLPTGVQHDLRDEGIIWDHHGNSPEQGFQVVGQL